MSFTIAEIKELEKKIAGELNSQPNSRMSTVIKVLTKKFGFREPYELNFQKEQTLFGENDTPVMGLKVVIVPQNTYDWDPEVWNLFVGEE